MISSLTKLLSKLTSRDANGVTPSYAFNLPYTGLLIRTLEKFPSPEQDDLKILAALYKMKSAAFSENGKEQTRITGIENKLGALLAPAVADDPLVFKLGITPDVHYKVEGLDIKFKIDTGAVTSVVDADNVDWQITDERREQLLKARRKYATTHPDNGYLPRERLKELPEEFHGLDFGVVTSFKLYRHRKGKATDADDAKKDDPSISKLITGNFDVIGISHPKIQGKKQIDEIRPVIELNLEGPGHPEGKYPFALNKRSMTRRGLIGRSLLADTGIKLMFGSADTPTIDPDRIDRDAVKKTLKYYL